MPASEQLERLAHIAGTVAGDAGPGVVMLHGVMPRSGTNYLHALLGLHPDTVCDPLDLRELPLLASLPDWRRAERQFFRFYEGNRGPLGDLDLMAHLTGGIMARAKASAPQAAQLVCKVPHTRYLAYLPGLFPGAHTILLTRSGPHVIQSTRKTWPARRFGKTFADLCWEWRFATEAALDHADRSGPDSVRLLRYEDVLIDPRGTLSDLCAFLGLDDDRIDEAAIGSLPVLGSSEASRADGTVHWRPVAAQGDFNPAGRPVPWTGRQWRQFEAIAGATMTRAGYDLTAIAGPHDDRTRTAPA